MVEINGTMVGGSRYAVDIGEMHRATGTCPVKNFVKNNALKWIVHGIVEAVRQYAKYFSKDLSDLCFITVVGEVGGRVGFGEHKKIEILVQKEFGFAVSLFRAKLSDLSDCTLGLSGELFYQKKEVAVFYYKCGLADLSCSPDVETKAWNGRLQIEKSRSIKASSIENHLLTHKMVQLKLSNKNILQKYLSSEEAESLAETFCEMVNLDNWEDPR